MYVSGYSEVSKHSPDARKKMQYRSKGKSCGYYMRIVFFFSSLIQSLIIVSLVLFLIYGKKQDSASTSRIQDLEETFSRLSIENVALRQQRKNLTNLLNTTLTEKARNDWDLERMRYYLNVSAILIQEMEKKMHQCNVEMVMCKATMRLPGQCQTPSVLSGGCNCGLLTEQLKARLEFVESNFTQTRQRMRMEMDQIAKDRDNINLEAIRLRRDKSTHEKEVEFYRQKCKDDFAQSLSGVSNVTKAFLLKVDSLFPTHIAFQLTCAKQREHLEQIRTNCTSLSRDVEDKFQRYLNSVGEQVSGIQGENSRLKAENWRLSIDYRGCSQNRTGLIQQHRQDFDKLQRKHDEDKERLLMDKMRLNGEIEVLHNSVKYKSKEAEHLTEQIRQLNMSCMSKIPISGFPGGSTSRGGTQSFPGFGGALNKPGSSPSLFSTGSGSSTGSGFNKPGSSPSLFSTGSGSSTGSGFNKPGSTGTGSLNPSLFSTGSGSSTGSGFNKPGSTGTGSLSPSLFSTGSGSSTGSGFNKPGSTGTGSLSPSLFSTGSGSSTGSGLNKPGSSPSLFSTGSGSSTGSGLNKPSYPSYGSAGSNPNLSSSGIGSNKPALGGRGSSTIGSSSGAAGSSSGSTGSTSKSGSSSSPFSWFGSNSGQSKTGSGTGRGTSSGNSNGGTGSSFGAGRTSGLVSVAQHLQDLQRIINPAGPEEKQDLSRMLG